MKAKTAETVHRKNHDAHEKLDEIRSILLAHGLVESDEELTVEMLEDLIHFAYFTGCISKREIKRILGLTEDQTMAKIRAWKRWQEGNKSCNLRQNPFYEGWTISPARRKNNI